MKKSILWAILALLLPVTQAWGHSGTHYGKITVAASGEGTVYLATSDTATSGDAEASWNCGGSESADSKTYWLFATPNSDEYGFEKWTKDGSEVSQNAKTSVSPKASGSSSSPSLYAYVASFAPYKRYNARLTCTASTGGKISVSGTSTAGEYTSEQTLPLTCDKTVQSSGTVTYHLFAAPDTDWDFKGWRLNDANGTLLSTERQYAYAVTTSATEEEYKDVKVYAVFATAVNYYAKAVVTAEGGGKVAVANVNSSSGLAFETSATLSSTKSIADTGATFTYYAFAKRDNGWWNFDGWYEGAERKSTSESYAFSVQSSATDEQSPVVANLTAKYVQASVVTATCIQDANGGYTISAVGDCELKVPESNVEAGSSEKEFKLPRTMTLTLSAPEAAEGYRFLNWWKKDADGNQTYLSAASCVTQTFTTATAFGAKFVPVSQVATAVDAASVESAFDDADVKYIEIGAETSFVIPYGKALILPEGKTLKVDGTIYVDGLLSGETMGDGIISRCFRTLQQTGSNGTEPFNPYGDVKYYKTASTTAEGEIPTTVGCRSLVHMTIVRADGVSIHSTPDTTKHKHYICATDKTKALNWFTRFCKGNTDKGSDSEGYDKLGEAVRWTYGGYFVVQLEDGQMDLSDFPSGSDLRSTKTKNNVTTEEAKVGKKPIYVDCAGYSCTVTFEHNGGSGSTGWFLNANVFDRTRSYNTNVSEKYINCKTVKAKINANGNYSSRTEIYDCGSVSLETSGSTDLIAYSGGHYYYSGGPYSSVGKNIRAYGGFFSVDPTGYLATADLTAEKRGDYWYVENTPNKTPFRVGEKEFETLEAAISAVDGTGVITLLSEYEVKSDVTIPAGKSVEIRLEGNSLSGSGKIVNNGTLIIGDGSNFTSGKGTVSPAIENNSSLTICYGNYAGGITSGDQSVFVAYNGTFSGALSLSDHADVTIYGGAFKNSVANYLKQGYGEKLLNGYYYAGELLKASIADTTLGGMERAWRISAVGSDQANAYLKSESRKDYTEDSQWYAHAKASAAIRQYINWCIDSTIAFDRDTAKDTVQFCYGSTLFSQNLDKEMTAGQEYRFLSPIITAQGYYQISYGRFVAGDPARSVDVGLINLVDDNIGTTCTIEMRIYSGNDYLTLGRRNHVLGAKSTDKAMVRPATGKATFYATPDDAFAADEENGTVMLTGDYAQNVTINKAGTYTLDPNGFAFTGSVVAGSGFKVVAEGNTYTVESAGVTITVPDVANMTKIVKVGSEAIGTEGTSFTVPQDAVVTVEYTPVAGYTGSFKKTLNTAETTKVDVSDVVAQQIVAKIGETPYASLAGAIKAMQPGDEIVVVAESVLTVGGYEMTVTSGNLVLAAYENGLEFKDGTDATVKWPTAEASTNVLVVTGGKYTSDPTAFLAQGLEAKQKDTMWVVGVKVVIAVDDTKPEAEQNVETIVTTDDQTSKVDEQKVSEVIEQALPTTDNETAAEKQAKQDLVANINTNTKVEGVKLTTVDEKVVDEQTKVEEVVKTNGVKAVVLAAKAAAQETVQEAKDKADGDKTSEEKTAEAFKAAIEQTAKDSEITVKVEVQAKLVEYKPPVAESAQAEDKTGSIEFELKPEATVTVTVKDEAPVTQKVEVSNDMIDQTQKIKVSMYAGFRPVQVLHRDDDGMLIEEFTGDAIGYDEQTGIVTVLISHFSSMILKQAAVDPSAYAVASITKNEKTTYYGTFDAAVEAAEAGDTIVVVNYSAEMTPPAGWEFVKNGQVCTCQKCYTYEDGVLKYGNVALTEAEVAAFAGVNVKGVRGFDNKVFATIQEAYEALSAVVVSAVAKEVPPYPNDDTINATFSDVTADKKINLAWNVWGAQTLPTGYVLSCGREQGFFGSYWMDSITVDGKNAAAKVKASTITVPWSYQYSETNPLENVTLTVSNLTLEDSDANGLAIARNGIGLGGTFTFTLTNCTVNGGINMAGSYQGNSVWNVTDNTFICREGGYTTYPFFLNGVPADHLADRNTVLNFTGNTVSGYVRALNFNAADGTLVVTNNTITPGTGYSAVQVSNCGTAEISGNTIHLNGGNVLTLHENLYGRTAKINVHDNVIDGTGYAVYDDVNAESKTYGPDGANVTLTWTDNSVATGASMDTKKGIKGSAEKSLSSYVYYVLNPVALVISANGSATNEFSTLQAACAAMNAGYTLKLLENVTVTETSTISCDSNWLWLITVDGNGKTITIAKDGVIGLSLGGGTHNRECYKAAVSNLTVVTADGITAKHGIYQKGGQVTDMKNVNVSGSYSGYAVSFSGCGGAVMDNCHLSNTKDSGTDNEFGCAVWSSVAYQYPITLTNGTTISAIGINKYQSYNPLYPRIFSDNTSSIGEIVTYEDKACAKTYLISTDGDALPRVGKFYRIGNNAKVEVSTFVATIPVAYTAPWAYVVDPQNPGELSPNVVKGGNVAMSAKMAFDTLVGATQAVPANGTITLTADCGESFAIADTKPFTLAKNGHDFTGTVTAPDGYALVDNGNGTMSYRAFNAVAEVVETGAKYETISDAIAAVSDGQTIRMLANVTLTQVLDIPAGKTFVWDLNGKTVENASTGFNWTMSNVPTGTPARMMVIVRGNVTLRDSSEQADGVIRAANYSYGTTKAVLVTDNGNLTVESGNISGGYAGIYVVGDTGVTASAVTVFPTLTLNGGVVSGSYGVAAKGLTACITVNDGATIHATGEFALGTNGTQDWYNGGNCVITVNGGTITSDGGCAVYNPAECLFTINGGTLTGKSSAVTVKGGQVVISGDASLVATGPAGEPGAGGSGSTDTGNALYVEDTYANHKPVVTVTGGRFKSANNLAALYYTTKADDAADKGSLTLSGGIYSSEPAAAYVAADYAVVANPDTETKDAYPWLIGIPVSGGKTALEMASDYVVDTNQVVITGMTESEQRQLLDEVATNTVVVGVKLTTESETNQAGVVITPSGVQSVINLAKTNETFAAALAASTLVTVRVDVVVTPVVYNKDASDRSAVFSLDPVATVSVNGGGSGDVSQTVEVSNEMIDQSRDILVTIPVGFNPAQIIHMSGEQVIETFSSGDFLYDAATRSVTLTISHFSSMIFKSQANVARVGGTDYSSLSEAIVAAATSGKPVSLLDNVALDAALTIAEGTSVTIDFAGKKLSWSGSATAEEKAKGLIVNNGTLALTDGSDAGNGGLNAGSGVFTTVGTTAVGTTIGSGYYDGAFPDSAKVVVSGGSFTMQVPQQNCAPGYEAGTQGPDGRYGVAEQPATVTAVATSARDPWNGFVDIIVTLTSKGAAEIAVTNLTTGAPIPTADLQVMSADGSLGTFTGSVVGSDAEQTLHLVWNSAAAVPTTGSVTLGVTATTVKTGQVTENTAEALALDNTSPRIVGSLVTNVTVSLPATWGVSCGATVKLDGTTLDAVAAGVSNYVWDTTSVLPGDHTLRLEWNGNAYEQAYVVQGLTRERWSALTIDNTRTPIEAKDIEVLPMPAGWNETADGPITMTLLKGETELESQQALSASEQWVLDTRPLVPGTYTVRMTYTVGGVAKTETVTYEIEQLTRASWSALTIDNTRDAIPAKDDEVLPLPAKWGDAATGKVQVNVINENKQVVDSQLVEATYENWVLDTRSLKPGTYTVEMRYQTASGETVSTAKYGLEVLVAETWSALTIDNSRETIPATDDVVLPMPAKWGDAATGKVQIDVIDENEQVLETKLVDQTDEQWVLDTRTLKPGTYTVRMRYLTASGETVSTASYGVEVLVEESWSSMTVDNSRETIPAKDDETLPMPAKWGEIADGKVRLDVIDGDNNILETKYVDAGDSQWTLDTRTLKPGTYTVRMTYSVNGIGKESTASYSLEVFVEEGWESLTIDNSRKTIPAKDDETLPMPAKWGELADDKVKLEVLDADGHVLDTAYVDKTASTWTLNTRPLMPGAYTVRMTYTVNGVGKEATVSYDVEVLVDADWSSLTIDNRLKEIAAKDEEKLALPAAWGESPEWVKLTLRDEAGNVVRTEYPDGSLKSWSWATVPMPPGRYTVTIDWPNAEGNTNAVYNIAMFEQGDVDLGRVDNQVGIRDLATSSPVFQLKWPGTTNAVLSLDGENQYALADANGLWTWNTNGLGYGVYTFTNVVDGVVYEAKFRVDGEILVNLENGKLPVDKSWYTNNVGEIAADASAKSLDANLKQSTLNGAPYWQNYVLGWSPTNANERLLIRLTGYDKTLNQLSALLEGKKDDRTEFGNLQLQYVLRSGTNTTGTAWTESTPQPTNTFTTPFQATDGQKYYKGTIILTPKE